MQTAGLPPTIDALRASNGFGEEGLIADNTILCKSEHITPDDLPLVISEDSSRENLVFCDFSDFELDKNCKDYEAIFNMQNQLKLWKAKGFSPGLVNSIHCRSAIKFYREELLCNDSVLSLLNFGYFPYLNVNINEIDSFEIRNNQSALRNSSFVIEQILDWKKLGYIEELDTKPWAINPLSVAQKYNLVDRSVKRRLCLDLGRKMNHFFKILNSRCDGIDNLVQAIQPDDFFIISDFKSMFLMLKLSPPREKIIWLRV